MVLEDASVMACSLENRATWMQEQAAQAIYFMGDRKQKKNAGKLRGKI